MPAKAMFLIRNSRGHVRTVIAFSHRGAVQEFLAQYPTMIGETISVKQRGSGSWQEFRVS